jgi:RNA polymerase sigma-70 factor (ECF subfamily)
MGKCGFCVSAVRDATAAWYPLYSFTRRRGDSAEEAQDHTQEFFARLLQNDYLDRADPRRGRFHAYLLICFKGFLVDDAIRSRAQKRGGGVATLPFEMSNGEALYLLEPFHDETPERFHERRWTSLSFCG